MASRRCKRTLSALVTRLRNALVGRNISLTNEMLEAALALHPLIDGIDSTLLDLAAEEIGTEKLVEIALQISDRTFASSSADKETAELLRNVFRLRAERIFALSKSAKLDWVRSTGTKLRLLDTVENNLLPILKRWNEAETVVELPFVSDLLEWALSQGEFVKAVRDEFQLEPNAPIDKAKEVLVNVCLGWLTGNRFRDIAETESIDINDLLSLHIQLITFALQTLVEQGLSLAEKIMEPQESPLSTALSAFAENLRYGCSTRAGCLLAAGGVRHGLGYVMLGDSISREEFLVLDSNGAKQHALDSLRAHASEWRAALGETVYTNTFADVS